MPSRGLGATVAATGRNGATSMAAQATQFFKNQMGNQELVGCNLDIGISRLQKTQVIDPEPVHMELSIDTGNDAPLITTYRRRRRS